MTEFFIASYPRSGNTYVRLLLDHYFGINARSVWSEENDSKCALTESMHQIRHSEHVAWKTHWPLMNAEFGEEDKGWPALLIVRDGRDSLVSHAHYQKDFWDLEGTVHGIMERMILPYYEIGGNWSEFHQYWLTRGNYVALRYEDLRVNPIELLKKALDELNIKWRVVNAEPLPDFEEYQRENPKFFRSGRIRGWEPDMTPELEEIFWKHHGEMMKTLGYQR